MHLHIGFSTAGLSSEEVAALQCHYMLIDDWEKGIDAEDNAVLISIPSTHDTSLAPEGFMVKLFILGTLAFLHHSFEPKEAGGRGLLSV